MGQIKKSILWGLIGMTLLLGLYFIILSLISGWNFTKSQFIDNWYWILGLSSGFGIQIGLFSYLRVSHRARNSGKVAAVSGTTSTIAMISCCAHYLVNILPIIGISGLVTIISQYQTKLFIIGLISNLLGIAYMVNKLIRFKPTQAKI